MATLDNGPKEHHRKDRLTGSFLDGGASHPIQKAALDLLSVESADREAEAIQRTFMRNAPWSSNDCREWAWTSLLHRKGLLHLPLFEDTPEPLQDGMEFFKAALEQRVIVVPGVFLT